MERILTKKGMDISKIKHLNDKIDALYEGNPADEDEKQLWKLVKDIGNEGAHIREFLEGSSEEKSDSATELFLIIVARFVMPEIQVKKVKSRIKRK